MVCGFVGEAVVFGDVLESVGIIGIFEKSCVVSNGSCGVGFYSSLKLYLM